MTREVEGRDSPIDRRTTDAVAGSSLPCLENCPPQAVTEDHRRFTPASRALPGYHARVFTIVVIAVAIGVFTMYFRHDREMRRKRLPPGKP